MTDKTESLPVLRVTESGKSTTDDPVALESPLTIILNHQELVTLLCSPDALEELAIGFLFSEGLLQSKDDLKKVVADNRRGVVRVETTEGKAVDSDLLSKRFITSGCGRGASFYNVSDIQGQAKVESPLVTSPQHIFSLVKEFHHRSQIYRTTGGVHSAALCDGQGILTFAEDIGRHNAVDKIFGHCILNEIPTDDRIIVTSGRISSEIVLKVSRSNIPLIVSKSAPTSLGVKLAGDLGVTLVGFARGKRMNIYTGAWRVAAEPQRYPVSTPR